MAKAAFVCSVSIFGRVFRMRMVTLSCVMPWITRAPGVFVIHCRESHELPGCALPVVVVIMER